MQCTQSVSLHYSAHVELTCGVSSFREKVLSWPPAYIHKWWFVYSGQEQILSFLEILQSEPIIWDPNHKSHKDKKKLMLLGCVSRKSPICSYVDMQGLQQEENVTSNLLLALTIFIIQFGLHTNIWTVFLLIHNYLCELSIYYKIYNICKVKRRLIFWTSK